MGKLHELLATESDITKTYEKMVNEAINSFTKKTNLYTGIVKSLSMTKEGDNEAVEKDAADFTPVNDTVHSKLNYIRKYIINFLDHQLRKEASNCVANEDLIVDGVLIAEKIPATALLGLESRLKKVRDLYASIPTLAPSIKWTLDEGQGKGIYTSEDIYTKKTEKEPKSKVLVPPTFPKEGEGGQGFPAQIEKWMEDKTVGLFTTRKFSGMLPPAEKANLLGRIDSLILATKKARQRANSSSIVKVDYGKAIMDFIHGSN